MDAVEERTSLRAVAALCFTVLAVVFAASWVCLSTTESFLVGVVCGCEGSALSIIFPCKVVFLGLFPFWLVFKTK